MKRSSNSVKFTPEPQQPPQNQECPEHTLEICSLLLAIDSQFTNAMRHFCGEEKAMVVAKMLRMLLRRLDVSDDVEEGLPVPNERQQHINIKQLRLLMPKCDEHELNQTWEFLLTSQQIDEAVNDGRPDMETLECLPFDALSVLLTWKTIELVGDVVAQELRNQLVNCGVIGILLDALSHYSQQPNRHERQIGPVEFQELEAVRQTSSTQCAVPKKRQKVPATRGRGGGRKPRAGTRRNNYPQAAVSATSLTAFDNNDQEMANKKNERCIEALLKLLNHFLLDSHLTQMEEQWLSLLYMSCLRNFVRAYLMNGDLNEVVRLSPLYGQLFQLLSTLSKVVHVFVEDVAKFYANGKKAEDEEEEVANPQTSNSQRKKEQPQPKRKKQKEKEEKEKEHPAPTSALLNAFDVVLGEDPDDNSRRTSNAACSSSTASAMAQPILTQLRSFGGKIDDHIKLLSNTEEPDEEELMTLSSLSSLCEDIINIVAEQQTILHQALKPAEPAASQSESSSSSDEEEEPANKTNVKAAQNRGRKKSDGGGFVADEAFSERYCQALKEFQFAMIPFDDDQLQVPHYFRDRFGVGVSNATANQRIRRIGKELFALRSDLPLAVSSSVFICTSEDHIDALKVLITGPEGTPYENGCFEFDFYLPADFPNVPPKVQFLTTGNGSVRFNPNLYNEGKVCLSLLGTWPGDNKDQEWNAEHSTINQVINSIQGLILVPDPYFNEPGYEPLRGKPQGKKNSFNYNVNIQQQTLRWGIIEQMRNPPRCFEQVVHKHFWLKRDQIRGQLERWSLDNKGLMAMKPKLEEEFSRLEGRMTERPE